MRELYDNAYAQQSDYFMMGCMLVPVFGFLLLMLVSTWWRFLS